MEQIDQMHIDSLQQSIDMSNRFRPLFENELFKEWIDLLAKKRDRYHKKASSYPQVGSVKYYDSVTESKSGRTETKVPFVVTEEEQKNFIKEMIVRENELNQIIELPKDMEKASSRALEELKMLKKQN